MAEETPLSAAEIYRQITQGKGTDSLGNAQNINQQLRSQLIDRAMQIRALSTETAEGWTGPASEKAVGAALPLIKAAHADADNVGIADAAIGDQMTAFGTAYNTVVPVSESKPEMTDEQAIAAILGGDTGGYDRQVAQWSMGSQQNIQAFGTYHQASTSNGDTMPRMYEPLVDPGYPISVADSGSKPSAPPPSGPPPGGSDAPLPYNPRTAGPITDVLGGTGGSTDAASPYQPPAPTPGGTELPAASWNQPSGDTSTSASSFAPPSSSTYQPGGGSGYGGNPYAGNPYGGDDYRSSTRGPLGTGPYGGATTGGEPVRGGTTGGYRPGGGAGGGTGGRAAVPGGGTGGRGAGPGAGAGERGMGKVTGSAPPNAGSASAGSGAATRGAGSTGTGGRGAMPMGAGAGRGRGGEDEQHQRPDYLTNPDPDETFGPDQGAATPAVIGEVKPKKKDR